MLRAILKLYVRPFRRHPIIASVAVTIALAIYAGALFFVVSDVSVSISYSFPEPPRLNVDMKPTEKYELGEQTVLMKRVNVSNVGGSLTNARIVIKVPDSGIDYSFIANPRILCEAAEFRPKEGEKLLQISCPSFEKGQVLEISLVFTETAFISPGTAAERGTFVVDVLGSYEARPVTGASATGSFSPTME